MEPTVSSIRDFARWHLPHPQLTLTRETTMPPPDDGGQGRRTIVPQASNLSGGAVQRSGIGPTMVCLLLSAASRQPRTICTTTQRGVQRWDRGCSGVGPDSASIVYDDRFHKTHTRKGCPLSTSLSSSRTLQKLIAAHLHLSWPHFARENIHVCLREGFPGFCPTNTVTFYVVKRCTHPF
ncbi:hypothetical protein LZ30DRAFT_281931 [Colletotrichum cereale]|nr:hypothetical protein LZ30DRAFT_281931 [Colletotrichum cereale]